MELTFRKAAPADRAALRAIVGGEPTAEQLAVAGGDARKARRFRALAMSGVSGPAGIERTTVAVDANVVVGLLQSGAEAGDSITPALAWGVIRIFGPVGVFRFLRRDRLRAKVHIAAPAETYHIAELHVSSTRRNAGIGAALLGEAERQARAGGFAAISLTTSTDNPARRLYERDGFEVVETRTDPEYRALTGVDGRILMMKQLD